MSWLILQTHPFPPVTGLPILFSRQSAAAANFSAFHYTPFALFCKGYCGWNGGMVLKKFCMGSAFAANCHLSRTQGAYAVAFAHRPAPRRIS
jgi:hypothetical protein